VKDLRRHKQEKLLNNKWSEILGPALCIYNDAKFSPEDIKGIQALGKGSKREEVVKTGK
jgi:sacsin